MSLPLVPTAIALLMASYLTHRATMRWYLPPRAPALEGLAAEALAAKPILSFGYRQFCTDIRTFPTTSFATPSTRFDVWIAHLEDPQDGKGVTHLVCTVIVQQVDKDFAWTLGFLDSEFKIAYLGGKFGTFFRSNELTITQLHSLLTVCRRSMHLVNLRTSTQATLN